MLTEYDPENPPVASRSDEADRLFGVAVGRELNYALYMWLVNQEISIQALSIFTVLNKHPIVIIVAVYLSVRVIWPLVLGFEHATINLWQTVEEMRN